MKISQEEIEAAQKSWFYGGGSMRINYAMRKALEAAYTIRKQRKAAKRERQRKERDDAGQKLVVNDLTWNGTTIAEMTTDELISAQEDMLFNVGNTNLNTEFYDKICDEIHVREERDKQVQDTPADDPKRVALKMAMEMGVEEENRVRHVLHEKYKGFQERQKNAAEALFNAIPTSPYEGIPAPSISNRATLTILPIEPDETFSGVTG